MNGQSHYELRFADFRQSLHGGGFAWINKGVYWLASGGAAPAPYQRGISDTTQIAPKNPLANVDRAFKMGMEQIGVYNKDAIIISFPQKPADAIYVCTDMDRGAWRDVFLDQYTLKQLPSSGVQIDQLKFADWLRRINYALHVGAIGNLPTKTACFAASLICASLPVTGFLSGGAAVDSAAVEPGSVKKQIHTA
ncbi:PepSY-associated TM helix domain-containing protein [Larkinella rosea]|uniref:PepSY-associated TM helix domain-containing protein n=1 Tax=Larkinella rosea TaxID=2025312 RepID=UPI001C8A6AA9|nr:PepSY-associated TM helix domain-containing protein [Larkinella rosea]